MTPDRDADRRRVIVDAARACFLQFGYSKTSLDDIAKRADLSRPLIYRTFANKEAICAAVFEDLFAAQVPELERAISGRGGTRAKLMRLCEIMYVEPWVELANAPMAAELYETCARVVPDVEAKNERARIKYLQAVLDSKELAEVFLLVLDGLVADLPSAAVLRRRVEIVVDKFAG